MANPPEEIVIKQEKLDDTDLQNTPATEQQGPNSTAATTNGTEASVEVKQERDVTTPVTAPAFTDGEPVGPPQPQVFGQQPPAPAQQPPPAAGADMGAVRVKDEPLDELPVSKPPENTQETLNMLNAFCEQMASTTVKQEPGAADNSVQEVEDVPEGFFDDFMTDDFMEGLNVIDEDDEEESKATLLQQSKKKEEEKLSKTKKIKSEEGDKHRRDPEKTRRDIQRDKAKCAQDKQKKMIKERLSVVETGLVPPGMEMEVDLQEVQEEDPKQGRRKRRSRSVESRPSRRRSRSTSITRRHQSRSSAADSRRSPSPVRRFKRSPDSRLSVRSPKRSPSSRRSHRKSPSPRRRVRRSRSRSRERYRSRSRSPRRRPKQKPFLEELAEKLNQTSSTRVTPGAAVMNSAAAAPQGMYPPTPQFYPMQPPIMQPAQPQFDCYDENYFLNGGAAGSSGMMMMDGSGMVGVGAYMAPQPVPAPVPPPAQFALPSAPTPQPMTYGMMPQVAMEPVAASSTSNQTRAAPAPPRQQATAPSNEDLAKLLAEKKISLSEYLSLTAKNEARPATTFNWQEKLKVLSRIQEAIDYLSGSRLYEGRLKVRKVHEKPQPPNGESPLARNPIVHLPFSSIDANQQANFAISFTNKLNNLLRFLDINLKFKSNAPPSTANKLPRRTRKRSHAAGTHRVGTSTFQKMTQTDPTPCEECEKRKEVRKVNVAIQCGTSITHNEATQFPDPNEDYPRRSSSSLASMTPAQLLRQVANRGGGVAEARDERMGGMRDDRMMGRADRDVWMRDRDRDERMMGGRNISAGYGNDFDMEEEGYLGRGQLPQFAPPPPLGANLFPSAGIRPRMPAQMRPAAPPALLQTPRYGGFNRF